MMSMAWDFEHWTFGSIMSVFFFFIILEDGIQALLEKNPEKQHNNSAGHPRVIWRPKYEIF